MLFLRVEQIISAKVYIEVFFYVVSHVETQKTTKVTTDFLRQSGSRFPMVVHRAVCECALATPRVRTRGHADIALRLQHKK